MHVHLFGPDVSDVKRSLFRKTPDGEEDAFDAVRFYNDEGETVFLLADAFIMNEDLNVGLYSFRTLMRDVEYVMTLDDATMIWTVIRGDYVKSPTVAIKHRSLLT